MTIESVKIQGDGWLVDGARSVPNDERNKDCREVLAYIAEGGIVGDEFTPEELEQQTAAARLGELQATDGSMARIVEDIYDYLSAADPAFLPAMPQGVKDKVADRKTKREAL